MAKKFAARVSKKDRKFVDLGSQIGRDIFKTSDEKLFKGVILDEISLKDIQVKNQVRTKFNDKSIQELAKNIQINGLIQPLVIHQNIGESGFTLICGERRFRAMSSISMDKAPCFILKNKTKEELMAIQFSENSSREDLHYIDQANGIKAYKDATGSTEREIVDVLHISKTEVHRNLQIASIDASIKDAAKKYDIEKYVLLEYTEVPNKLKIKVYQMILDGLITKRLHLKRIVKDFTKPSLEL